MSRAVLVGPTPASRPRRAPRGLLSLALLSLGAFACGGPGPATTPQKVSAETEDVEPPEPEVATARLESFDLTPAKVEVVVRDPGQAPRRELRYTASDGEASSFGIASATRSVLILGAKAAPAAVMPETRMSGRVTLADTEDPNLRVVHLATGGVTVAERPGVPAGFVEAAQARFAAFEGFSLRLDMQPHGQIGAAKLEMKVGADPEIDASVRGLAESILRAAVVLPTEPVGLGAEWSATQSFDQMGTKVTETVTYTLTALEAEGATFDVEVTQTAPPGPFAAPGLPDGSTAVLESLETSGRGELTLRWTQPFPVESSASLHSRFAARIEAGEQQQALALEIDAEMRLGEPGVALPPPPEDSTSVDAAG